MVIKGKKNDNEEMHLEVQAGRIGRAEKYKYLGDMYDESGTNVSKINHKESKINMMIMDIKRETSSRKLGKAAISARLMLMQGIITPTILANTETWHNITKREQTMIRKIHQEVLTRCLDIPKTTPYLGIVSELGILPYNDIIWYKKFMWYYRISNSNDTRVVKTILLTQMKETDNWYTEIVKR